MTEAEVGAGALTAEAAAAEYRMGGNWAGTARGAGADGVEEGWFANAEVVVMLLEDRDVAERPEGRVAVPSRVGFLCPAFVFAVVGLRSEPSSWAEADAAALVVEAAVEPFLAGVLVGGAEVWMSEVSAIDIESWDDRRSSSFFTLPNAPSSSSRLSSS